MDQKAGRTLIDGRGSVKSILLVTLRIFVICAAAVVGQRNSRNHIHHTTSNFVIALWYRIRTWSTGNAITGFWKGTRSPQYRADRSIAFQSLYGVTLECATFACVWHNGLMQRPRQTSRDRRLEQIHLRLVTFDSLLLLSLLAAITGVLSGLIIIIFRFLIESIQAMILPARQVENYEALSIVGLLLLPIAGALIIALIYRVLPKDTQQVGVVHVMERLAYHQAHLPLANALWQFFGAAISIICGFSLGREGPSIHLGAASGSLFGQWIKLPNNTIRILAACGIAGAIGASFNTPLAGVVFSMEVVLMEYTLVGFIPIILASVSATALAQWVYGGAPAFRVPPVHLHSLQELPYLLFVGLVIGLLAICFIRAVDYFSGFMTQKPDWQKLAVAAIATGLCAIIVPQIMGIGYDTVNAALLGQLSLEVMLGVVAFKLIATAVAIGLGLPGGLIGPTLVIGATAGGVMGLLGGNIFDIDTSPASLYAMIGMGAMMGATLHAPLAALTAMVELTANPNIVLPGMLVIVVASITCRELFGNHSVFYTLMLRRGLDYRNDPLAQSLRRIAVGQAMSRNFVVADQIVSPDQARSLITGNPRWIVIRGEEQKLVLLPSMDLARFIDDPQNRDAESIDLLGIPALRSDLATVTIQATLQEALDSLQHSHVDAVAVCGSGPRETAIYGVLTRDDIEARYRVPS